MRIGKRQELAQHTQVLFARQLAQMPVTLVLHALATRRLTIFTVIMNMQGRDEEHWQINCQQHPRCDMSLCCRFHGCKISAITINETFLILLIVRFAFQLHLAESS